MFKSNAAEQRYYPTHFPSLSKPGSYITHNATWPLKVHSSLRYSMLVATNVTWSLWLQAEVWIKLLRFGQLAFLKLHIKDILHFQAHMTHMRKFVHLRVTSLLTYGHAEDVGLQLHQQPVGRHASVHLQHRQRDAAVLVHRLEDLSETSMCHLNTNQCQPIESHTKPQPPRSFTPDRTIVEIAADIKMMLWYFQSLIGLQDYYYRDIL